MELILSEADALIVVDVQRDFCPGGALPVAHGDRVVSVINRYIRMFASKALPVFATRDWHPENHVSFKSCGGAWPPHCVRETEGAEFHPELKLSGSVKIISKATTINKEAYSGFHGTRLEAVLKKLKVRRVFVGGLATDYCVKHTVLDALKAGFTVFFLTDASKAVDVNPDDGKKAIEEMLKAGALGITINEISLISFSNLPAKN